MDGPRAALACCLGLLTAAALVGCGAIAETPTPVPDDPECYSVVSLTSSAIGWTLMSALPAPANQPWVHHPADCRYRVSAQGTGKQATLDPAGCFGLDPGGSEIILRTDFCPAGPSAS